MNRYNGAESTQLNQYLSTGGPGMYPAIIVEGKNDRARLRRLLHEDVLIPCTFGTLSSDRLEKLKRQVGDRDIYIFTDNDSSGKKIRGILRDAFPDAVQIYTRRGYAGVEGTPDDYLIQQLEKAELNEYIVYPDILEG
jgi:toprim domain protein